MILDHHRRPAMFANMSTLPSISTRRAMKHRRSQGRGVAGVRDREAGFTLLEILIATALVGLVALAIAPLMLMAVQTSAVAQQTSELTASASERIETLRALPFTHPDLAAGGSLTSTVTGYALDPLNGDANRYIRWQVTDVSASRKHIELVSGVRTSVWGPPREVALETYRADLQ
jgi:prepilin-type N-terminal cleavage/methylation domain-containing protein